jgi:hypothetical protein
LKGIVVNEGLLHGIECASVGETFDRRHVRAVFHDRQGQTGVDALAIHQDRASPALPMVASLFGAGQVEVLAQGVEQGRPRRHVHLFLCAVNSEYDSSRRGQ